MTAGDHIRCAYCGVYYGGHLESCYYGNMVVGMTVSETEYAKVCTERDELTAMLRLCDPFQPGSKRSDDWLADLRRRVNDAG